ncbi:glycosyltransferase family 9 protein [Candidatus Nitrosacidococcus sp. I8]|uniref:glycosyltransferase family 9 protein n=1 Tax=Candidatus Nitrosacidococcus sp. I8 TaxID=2942908 RepID=UPI002227C1E9|nr:glycosyltransferase family 9 protein [Candidatus Nitrosacidococcus sp. I8]CAH9019268.1 hypothetical protein NURINAE_01434 [Candidatus Nitrosacidococcus sp. I8]
MSNINPYSVLIIQPLPGIGDMIWHLPTIHAIADTTPDKRITLLTKLGSQAHQLLIADSTIKQILWLYRKPGIHDGFLGMFRLAKLLRQHNFCQAWILHGSLRYAFICWIAGIPKRAGYGRGLQRYFLNHLRPLPQKETRDHPLALATKFLTINGIPAVESEPQLTIDSKSRDLIRQSFQHLPRPWIVLGIGSSEPYKQWGELNFIQLIWLLKKEIGTVFIVGGESEHAIGQTIYQNLQQLGIHQEKVIGFPLDQVIALLAVCNVYIGNDTGVLNIAAAVNTHAWGLFGASPTLQHSQYIHSITPSDTQGGMSAIFPEEVAIELKNNKRKWV